MIYSIKSKLLNRIDPTTSKPLEIELDLFNPYKNGLVVGTVTGTGPVKANITMDDWAIVDGARFNKARIPKRNIVIPIIYVGDTSVEELRHMVYKYFPEKEKVQLTFVNDSGEYNIEGYIEDNNVPMWVKQEQSQISILCENPYFYRENEIVQTFVKSIPQFHFHNGFFPSNKFFADYPQISLEHPTGHPTPAVALLNDIEEGSSDKIYGNLMMTGRKIRSHYITVDNISTIPIGLKINMTALGSVENPRFVNLTTNEGFYLKGTFEKGTAITIDTRSGYKRVSYGDGTNAITTMDILQSKWIQLQPGENIIKYGAKTGSSSMDVSVSFRPLYEGI